MLHAIMLNLLYQQHCTGSNQNNNVSISHTTLCIYCCASIKFLPPFELLEGDGNLHILEIKFLRV